MSEEIKKTQGNKKMKQYLEDLKRNSVFNKKIIRLAKILEKVSDAKKEELERLKGELIKEYEVVFYEKQPLCCQ